MWSSSSSFFFFVLPVSLTLYFSSSQIISSLFLTLDFLPLSFFFFPLVSPLPRSVVDDRRQRAFPTDTPLRSVQQLLEIKTGGGQPSTSPGGGVTSWQSSRHFWCFLTDSSPWTLTANVWRLPSLNSSKPDRFPATSGYRWGCDKERESGHYKLCNFEDQIANLAFS